ncbi:hypothetical protein [Uliginosibacterium sediminicola]|uniref:Uncharacterized protein n=1 Tax=Uliginosibacterium sediminicola TaxID=2024550 RepID=A0ABU9Z325_9RHOO
MSEAADKDFFEAMVALSLWRNTHPDKKIEAEPAEIMEKRRIVMVRLSSLQEGDVDPWMGQRVEILIRKSSRYIVYLDDKLEIQWWWTQRLSSEEGMSVIQANIMRLSCASNFLLDAQSELLKAPFPKLRVLLRWLPWFRRMNEAQQTASVARARDSARRIRMLIAESMAMVLNGVSRAECEKVQAMAEDQILIAKDQLCRPVFFWWFIYVLCLLGLASLASHWLDSVCPALTGISPWLQAALAGAFGALLSVTTRTRSLRLEPESGKRGLRMEAVSRLLIGVGAGILVHLAFEAEIILKGALSSTPSIANAAHAFLCIASGWSEKILPSLLGRAESFVSSEAAEK